MSIKLYPLKFNPIYSYRIWGGDKLRTVLNKSHQLENIGESWEISDVKNNETEVSEGALKGKTLKDLIKVCQEDFVGKSVYENFGTDFPLLIKFIDAKTPLSIQVHPGNELAKERHDSFGKNEMWYVMQAEEDAELIVGFNQDVKKEGYIEHLKKGTLNQLLNIEKVTLGDTFYIPTGRVHAIGAGVLLAEIQQTSNITYRIYDYDRVDKKTGDKRELHTELAVDAIDFKYYKGYRTSYKNGVNSLNTLVNSPYFKTNFLHIKSEFSRDLQDLDSFVIYMCVEGSTQLICDEQEYSLHLGETILVPAIMKKIYFKSKYAKVIEIFM
jgi:mannose-6-phosphate isomerase